MAYFVGLAFLAIGLILAWSGYTHKKASLAEAARIRAQHGEASQTELHPSLSMLVDFAPSLTVFSLFLIAGGLTLAFFAVGAQRHVTLFDLGGMHAAIVGYGYWMTMKTKYRSVETQRTAQRSGQRSGGETAQGAVLSR